MSTFCGKLIEAEFKGISIDSFTKENCESSLFFLSHYHSDHMKDIQQSHFVNKFLNDSDARIYCSNITKQLLTKNYQWAKLKSHKIVILDKNSNLIHLANGHFNVTPLHAGHCPGSVMFLFEGFDLRILYTGDFRCTVSDIKNFKALHGNNGDVLYLDSIYLDTTFVDADYIEFPSRDESLGLLTNIIQDWFTKENNRSVSIKATSNIGLEFLMVELSKSFNTPIFVTHQGYEHYQFPLLGVIDLVTDSTKSRIHFCLNKYGKCDSCLDGNLVIYPTSFYFDYLTLQNEGPVAWINEKHIKVAYFSHSSLSEIRDIINYLNPKNIIPCVVHNISEQDIINLIRYIGNESIADSGK